MSYFKFGVHAAGVGGNYDGFGDYVAACGASDAPCIVQAVDNAGPAEAAAALARERDVIVFRMTSRGGVSLDQADYATDPVAFARQRMVAIEHHWPYALDRAKVWTVPVNEPSKEPGDIEWLAAFTLECARISIANGWRHLAYGWSMGTPEADFWELPDVLAYLRLCSQYPHLLGVSLHEYSGDDDIADNYPYLVGRYEFLHDICDDHNISHPPIVIGEFGWREASLRPKPGTFESQLQQVQALYNAHDNILGAAIWTLGQWHGTVANDLAGHMATLSRMAAATPYEPPVDDPVDPPGDTWQERAWAASVAEQIARGIPLNPGAAIQGAILRDGFVPVHREIVIEGVTVQGAEALSGKPRRIYQWQSGQPVRYFLKPGDTVTPPPPPGDLIDLRRFMIADPHCWRVVRHPNGSQEDVQDMALGGGLYVRRKNGLAEWWRLDEGYFYLVHDTSPAPDSAGNERCYTLRKNGRAGAPKNKIKQRLGEVWRESTPHQVEFRAKAGCRPLAENSGQAYNSAVITRHEVNFTFNGFGQALRFDEVVWLQTGVETQIYGIIGGRPAGWIGWSAPWGQSQPVEVHWDRPVMTTEPNRYCGF